MATLGYRTLVDGNPPSLWNMTELERVRMMDGVTFDQVVNDIQAALQLLNRDLLSDPLVAGMYAVQNNPDLKYAIGVTNGFVELTEFGRPDPGRGGRTGHMIPFNRRGRSLGWSMQGLMESSSDDVDTDVRSAIRDARNEFPKRLLQRFFKMEAEDVRDTSGSSVPLADGGTTDSTYVPIEGPDGQTFTSSHDHFLRHAAISNANVNLVAEHLFEHGHEAPYDLLAAEADAATWTALTKWKAPTWTDLNYAASATERANISDVSRYNGYLETDYGLVRVKFTYRVPTAYFGAYKNYGPLDPRNPLRVRIMDVYGFGYRILPGNWVNSPEQLAVIAAMYGVGIGSDRTNGVCVEIDAAGDYATPTIS
jgi:hypothetical protein